MADEVYCPFDSQGVCRGECPTNRERACIDGEPINSPASTDGSAS